ncbi:MAG: hypothetical protein GY711_04900 [bacterium]|nr:hypothetical protein [bacterium]
MAKSQLFTETCVRKMAPGAELHLGPGRIATPAALDLASERGIRVRYFDGKLLTEKDLAQEQQQSSSLWNAMKASDGTYVVVVSGGKARVTRLADTGPVNLGEE